MPEYPSESIADANVRVLVVDDEPATREVLCDILTTMNYACECVGDGPEALKKLEEAHVDLVLLDLVLPHMNGEQVFAEIKAIRKDLPVIIITAHGSIKSSVELLRNGAVDYLTKPINVKEFRFRVHRALEEQRLKVLAITDIKTQLYNHQYFERRLEEEIRRAQRYRHSTSLVMLDLDNFKDYNDTYGHLAGDEALVEVASLIKELVRDCDIPCRFGGEEFSVILPETDLSGARQVAEKIRVRIQDNEFNGASDSTGGKITISAGIATHGSCPNTDATASMRILIDEADKALYKAKKAGKNNVCFAETAE